MTYDQALQNRLETCLATYQYDSVGTVAVNQPLRFREDSVGCRSVCVHETAVSPNIC